MSKPKLALYWAASCGGCDIAVLDIEEKILDVAEFFDIVFWPCAMDFKYSDVENMKDKDIDVCLFNGAIRTSKDEHLAQLLRKKSKVLVAFGSCAHEGCIPGLANFTTKEAIFDYVYKESPSTQNDEFIKPQLVYNTNGVELDLPDFLDYLRPLDNVVEVDYYVPGCPPQPHQILAVITTIMEGKPLPPPGSTIGAGEKTCCDECPRTREEKRIRSFHRVFEIVPDNNKCLLDQGVLCMGPATRGGCGALCVKANMPCRGCYGSPPNVSDQGLKMISALSSVIDSQDEGEVNRIVNQITDLSGTIYRFSLAHSMLKRKQIVGD
jgi:F420-non-reducing hydrogenase small subunit